MGGRRRRCWHGRSASGWRGRGREFGQAGLDNRWRPDRADGLAGPFLSSAEPTAAHDLDGLGSIGGIPAPPDQPPWPALPATPTAHRQPHQLRWPTAGSSPACRQLSGHHQDDFADPRRCCPSGRTEMAGLPTPRPPGVACPAGRHQIGRSGINIWFFQQNDVVPARRDQCRQGAPTWPAATNDNVGLFSHVSLVHPRTPRPFALSEKMVGPQGLMESRETSNISSAGSPLCP
jgi:hypothetical protein